MMAQTSPDHSLTATADEENRHHPPTPIQTPPVGAGPRLHFLESNTKCNTADTQPMTREGKMKPGYEGKM